MILLYVFSSLYKYYRAHPTFLLISSISTSVYTIIANKTVTYTYTTTDILITMTQLKKCHPWSSINSIPAFTITIVPFCVFRIPPQHRGCYRNKKTTVILQRQSTIHHTYVRTTRFGRACPSGRAMFWTTFVNRPVYHISPYTSARSRFQTVYKASFQTI